MKIKVGQRYQYNRSSKNKFIVEITSKGDCCSDEWKYLILQVIEGKFSNIIGKIHMWNDKKFKLLPNQSKPKLK